MEAFQHKLTKLKEQVAQFDEAASSAVVSRSVSALCRRWTQLNSVARAQEKALKDTVHDWRCFKEKVRKQNIALHHYYMVRTARKTDCNLEMS